MADPNNAEKKEELLDFWFKKWDLNITKWQEPIVNCYLEKYFERIRSIKDKDKEFRVLVPLCGKSLDLKWLLDKGCHVVGVEGVEKGIKEFFQQHNLPFDVTTLQNQDRLYQCKGLPLCIYHCNFFDFQKYNVGKFDFVWDRGSFVSLSYGHREKYASVVKSLYAPKFHHLIESLFYESSTFDGPPRTLSLQEVKELLGKEFSYEQLETENKKEKFEKQIGASFDRFDILIFLISAA